MKSRVKWAVAVAIALLVVVAAGRAWMGRKGPATDQAKPQASMQLAPSDIATAKRQDLIESLDITGAIKAVNTAVIKAKVAAELQQLTVREGDTVTEGQVLGRLDATEYTLRVRQGQEQAAQAKAQLDIAQRALDSNRALVEQGFISKNALDTSVSNAASARAALQAARAATDLAVKSLNDTVLRAPISGMVSQRMAQPGERVAIDAKLLEIVDLSKLEIEAALAPEDVGAVRIGASASLRVDGLTEPVAARVARINPSTQTGTRAVLVYLAVDPQPGLRQGLFARGRIDLERKTALAVPESTVRTEQARPYVLELTQGKVMQRTVVLGARAVAVDGSEPLFEVLQGLSEGAVLLRSTVGIVREGTLAQVSASAPSTQPPSATAASAIAASSTPASAALPAASAASVAADAAR